jgi:hypothetical protein
MAYMSGGWDLDEHYFRVDNTTKIKAQNNIMQ